MEVSPSSPQVSRQYRAGQASLAPATPVARPDVGARSTAWWSVQGVTRPLMQCWSRRGQARHEAAPAA
jgi:hypothetical protein